MKGFVARKFLKVTKFTMKTDEIGSRQLKENVPFGDLAQIRRTYISEISSREEGLSILSA